MRHGGPRPRWAPSHDRRVYGHGRWGPRRVRVTECWSILRAEDVYTGLLQDDAARVAPGARGIATFTAEGREFIASWEVRQNTVWPVGGCSCAAPDAACGVHASTSLCQNAHSRAGGAGA